MSLALSTLLYEWRRYTAAMVALAFSGLLVLAQVGMFTGIVKASTATIERSRADIMILAPKSESLVNGPNTLPARIQPLIYLNPNVVEVAALGGSWARFQNIPKDGQKQVTEGVQINIVDPRPGAVTLPIDYSEDVRRALMEPYAVAVDRTALGALGVKAGDMATLNGRTVYIRGILENYPNVNNKQVVMSRDSLRLLGMAGGDDKTGPLMVRIRDASQAEAVRDQLNAVAKDTYRAWTKEELSKANQKAIMKEQIIGIFLGFSLFLGFLIGVGITSQTLRGAILSSIKEFASLRALGVSMGSLRLVILELSFWVGIAGLLATALLTWGVAALASGSVPMSFPANWIITVAILLLVIAMFSGLLALGILKKSQPADLLR
ncbi:ABC transporter permease [Phenylobacterium deserti]|uniref:ABC transporter permease n=1 Tax=Phenylobacterium deserti TaxID=1914756 RepID=A0A328APS5_9CAUL|nr:ABC transporter permease [Phenylobacterium deserti]RAK56597.1 ABC transporter permease [Phenylobacterium deserti]